MLFAVLSPSYCGSEWIRLPRALGKHIRSRRQANSAQGALSYVRYNGRHMSPSKVPIPMGGSGPHVINIRYVVHWADMSAPERHLDWFSRFCTALQCAQRRDRQTYGRAQRQTTLRATSVAISRIYAIRADNAAEKSSWKQCDASLPRRRQSCSLRVKLATRGSTSNEVSS